MGEVVEEEESDHHNQIITAIRCELHLSTNPQLKIQGVEHAGKEDQVCRGASAANPEADSGLDLLLST